MRLELGKQVRCADDAVRELADVVIDSTTSRVTHLVVQPHEEADAARLVPVQLVDGAKGDGELALRCTAEKLEALDSVHEFAFMPPGSAPKEDPEWEVGVEDVYLTPNYAPSTFGEYSGDLDSAVGVSYDRIPKGEIELRRASAVYSVDGHHLGRVVGVDVDADDRLTSVLLERGHFWWRRELKVPLSSVAKLENDAVKLGLSKRELRGLPSTRVR